MSPWDVIGWAIAIPFVLFSFLLAFAFVVAMVRHATKKEERKPEPRERRLRIVEDDDPA